MAASWRSACTKEAGAGVGMGVLIGIGVGLWQPNKVWRVFATCHWDSACKSRPWISLGPGTAQRLTWQREPMAQTAGACPCKAAFCWADRICWATWGGRIEGSCSDGACVVTFPRGRSGKPAAGNGSTSASCTRFRETTVQSCLFCIHFPEAALVNLQPGTAALQHHVPASGRPQCSPACSAYISPRPLW